VVSGGDFERFARAGGPHNCGCPIQSCTLQLSGVSRQTAISSMLSRSSEHQTKATASVILRLAATSVHPFHRAYHVPSAGAFLPTLHHSRFGGPFLGRVR
jgi:hypothetical protein